MKARQYLWTLLLIAIPCLASAAGPLDLSAAQQKQVAQYLPLLLTLSLLSFLPAVLVAMTPFTRILITLSFLRHGLGMPETPPNTVLIILAMFLTFFTMGPTFERSYSEGIAPFLEGKVNTTQGFERTVDPFKTFMSAHVRDEDLRAVSEIAHLTLPESAADVPIRVLVPAFLLSELRAAFVSGFIIFLPFLLIDLIVAAILMALGMMMVPPVSISLPLKVMLFVLIDGWSLLLKAIAGAYS